MLLKEKIVNVGVGQCGCNYAKEAELMGFNSFYVNTSLEDLMTIQTENKNKYHIKGTKGMAKDREMAKECILKDKNDESIAYAINDQYSMSDIVFVYFSLSGGTGGTMANYIIEAIADIFPHKTINVVITKGKSSEDVGLQANAIESLKHLLDLHKDGIVTQIHLLDNDTRKDDVFSINRDFIIALDRFVSFGEISEKGNLDEEEKEKLLMESGFAVLLEFENEDFLNGLNHAKDNTIYAEWTKTPRVNGIILNDKQNTEDNHALVKEVLGRPLFTHSSSWTENSNVLLATGLKFNEKIMEKLNITAKELLDLKRKEEEESLKAMEVKSEVAFDTTSILSQNNRRRPSTNENQPSQPTRRRRESSGSDQRDRYRNMR